MKPNEIPLLAIDGGGTKTAAVVTDGQGHILQESIANASNYQAVGAYAAKQALLTAVSGVLPHASREIIAIKKAVFALAGIDTEEDEKQVKALVQEALAELPITIQELHIENDCVSALLGATGHQPGVLLIAGTGSIACAHDGSGTVVRSGGWGHRAGDEGSGHWIGMEAIRAVFRIADGRERQPSILPELILHHFGFCRTDQLYDWIYSGNDSVDEVARLAKHVEIACKDNDAVSKNILERAAEELMLLADAAINKAQLRGQPFPIILQGGVLQHNEYIRKQLKDRMSAKRPEAYFIENKEQPIHYIIQRGLL
ncbi:N-acetylglucosamine kinase [Bacillus testis]|uniref:N-acetylglucosamine kinase n=1 Tax=Bacillus testis TaxID=1622072 RepID=UPI00067F6BA9|nr:BadF/BadG/BcrA/BcrD ATPase family protein [Bacillus testis]